MPTPRTEYWKNEVAGQPENGPWRRSSDGGIPAPPAEVFWRARRRGEPPQRYRNRAELGAVSPTFKAAQLP
jgi:hypothetical protein